MNAVLFRLWRLSTASSLVSWLATKTFISALYMNDTMLVTGDYRVISGSCKIVGAEILIILKENMHFKLLYLIYTSNILF